MTAFRSATGYGNLPNGNFSPEIFSRDAQLAFRKAAVCEAICNNKYQGEIAAYGSSVRIIKEPEITISDYSRGQKLVTQPLNDEDFQLVVDQAKSFQFGLDDIEEAHSHVDYMDMAADRAAYDLRDAYDANVLGYACGYDYDESTGVWTARTSPSGTKADSLAGNDELLASQKLDYGNFGGSAGNSIAIAPTNATYITPLKIINRMKRIMDRNNVPKEDRWIVLDPVILEILQDEDSNFVDNDLAGGQDAGDLLRNGRVGTGMIRQFKVYESNNLPSLGTGPETVATGGSNTNFGVIIAGHSSAISTASQILKTERLRSQDSFADIVRGLQVFGRKILRPESIVTAEYNLSA